MELHIVLIYRVLHSHYAGLNSIFSPGDLQDLFLKMREPLITDEFFISLVTAEGTAYVLQVKDRQAFIAFGNKYLADEDKLRSFKNKEYIKKYNLNSGDKIANENNFLKMMSDFDMGITLAGTSFAADAQPSPNLFNNLQQKTYNKLTGLTEPYNCN